MIAYTIEATGSSIRRSDSITGIFFCLYLEIDPMEARSADSGQDFGEVANVRDHQWLAVARSVAGSDSDQARSVTRVA